MEPATGAPSMPGGWNARAGDEAARAAAECELGVRVSDDEALWRHNAWSPFVGCTLRLTGFEIIEPNKFNRGMRAMVALDKPTFAYGEDSYTESILGMELVYLVAGYVSESVRVVRVQGSAEFAVLSAEEATSPDETVYTYRSSVKGLFRVRAVVRRADGSSDPLALSGVAEAADGAAAGLGADVALDEEAQHELMTTTHWANFDPAAAMRIEQFTILRRSWGATKFQMLLEVADGFVTFAHGQTIVTSAGYTFTYQTIGYLTANQRIVRSVDRDHDDGYALQTIIAEGERAFVYTYKSEKLGEFELRLALPAA